MLTENRLIELNFERKENTGQVYFSRNGFILKSELGKWLFCAEHNGYVVTTLLWIETEFELATLYSQSTQLNIYLNK